MSAQFFKASDVKLFIDGKEIALGDGDSFSYERRSPDVLVEVEARPTIHEAGLIAQRKFRAGVHRKSNGPEPT